MRKNDFRGKTVYITGGSSGIGLAVAKLCCSFNANVYIFARRKHQLSLAVQEIIQNKKGENQHIDFMKLDVSNYSDVKKVILQAINDFGLG